MQSHHNAWAQTLPPLYRQRRGNDSASRVSMSRPRCFDDLLVIRNAIFAIAGYQALLSLPEADPFGARR